MKLCDLLTLKYGKDQKKVSVDFSDYPIYGTGGIMGYASQYLYDKESILFGRKGSIKGVQFMNKPFWCVDTTFYSVINENIALPKYLFYKLSTIDFSIYDEGTTMPSLRAETLNNIDISIDSLETQRHIVDTIGSIDDLIENIDLQITKINQLGLLKIDKANDVSKLRPLKEICSFEKGYEVGSKAYSEIKEDGFVRFIRVGDLANGSKVYVNHNSKLRTCKKSDTLVAFDGAPGRIGTGFDGAYSSGLQKVICVEGHKGFVYFELKSSLNQKIISDNSQGTTILHASKAIDHLQYCDCNAYTEFNHLYSLMITLETKKQILEEQKKFLLDRYFS